MPLISFASRYRPQVGPPPYVAPGVLTPFEDDTLPSLDPDLEQTKNLQGPPSQSPYSPPIPKPPQQADTQTGASLADMPPLNPDSGNGAGYSGLKRMSAMPPPGEPPPRPSAAPEITEPPPTIQPEVAMPQGARPTEIPVGQKPPSQGDKALAEATTNRAEAEKARPADPKNNWAQRLGLAIISMTRLAPVAQQIIHPKWAEQELGYGRKMGAADRSLKAAEGIVNTEGLAEQREASAAAKNASTAQADAYRRSTDPHAGQQSIDPEYAKANLQWIRPNAQGEYWVPDSVAAALAKPEPGDKYTSVAPGATLTKDGKPIFTAPAREEKVTGEFQTFYLPNFAKKLGKAVDQLTPEENERAFREFKQDPEAKAASDASRSLSDTLKQMQIGQQPTPEQAKQVAADMVAHRIAPEQMASMFGGFGQAGQNFKRMVYAEAKRLDPEFDFEQAAAEYGLVKSPAFQNTIRYIDSVRGSIPLVLQRAKELANGRVRFINGLANMGREQLNDPKLKQFQGDALLVADEIAKILQGGGTGNGTSDAKLAQANSIIRATDSPEALAAVLADVSQLIGFRRKALTRGTYMENQQEHPGGGQIEHWVRDKSGKLVKQ